MLLLFILVILWTIFYQNNLNYDYAGGCGTSPKVQYYTELLNDTVTDRVYTGERINVGDWPWLVSVAISLPDNKIVLCTGSIVAKQWILTAAHCVYYNNITHIAVSYGSVEINDVTNNVAHADIYYIHPQYKSSEVDHDIALIKLRSLLKFSSNVHAVCIGENVHPTEDEVVVVVGYGKKYVAPSKMESISYAREAIMEIRFQENDLCNKNSSTICSFGYNQGTTKGDSGGSLMALRNNVFYSAGVVSSGSDAKISKTVRKVYSYYAKTSSYCDWIAEKTNKEVKCDNKTFS